MRIPPHAALFVTLLLASAGCLAAPGEGETDADVGGPDAAHGDHDHFDLHEVPDHQKAALAATSLTVDEAVWAACGTSIVAGLSEQLIEEVQCLHPGSMKPISGISGVSLGSAVFPYLQAPAADALRRAASRRRGTLFITSGLRTLAQQYLLRRWDLANRCGIAVAAPPGKSNHNGGLAIDTSDWSAWKGTLEGAAFRWLGSFDPVHFDYVGRGGIDLRTSSVLAFQRLWNRNHPSDRIAEDGSYGPQTESRLRRAPAGGFALGASCGTEPEPKPEPEKPALAAMGLDWIRTADGTYVFRVDAPSEVVRVDYRVDRWTIGEGHRADGDDFAYAYAFTTATNERTVTATGFDASGEEVAQAVGLLDVTDDFGVYVRQTGESEYEIGLERAPSSVGAIEVRADTYVLTDSETGLVRSTRNAVRSPFSTLGERNFEIRTYGSDGSWRGTLRRTFELR